MENTPEVENKYTELTPELRKAEIEKIKTAMSEAEVKEVFTIKTETTPVPAAPKPAEVSQPKNFSEPDAKLERVAQTLMSQGIERVKQLYKDFDVTGITNDSNLDTLSKVQLLSTVAEPNAIKMATIERNLKGNDNTEGTGNTETKKAQFSAPDKTGKLDTEAGVKLYTQMCEKLGLDIDDVKEKSD